MISNNQTSLQLCTFWTMENQVRIIPIAYITKVAYAYKDIVDTSDIRKGNILIEIKDYNKWHEIYNKDTYSEQIYEFSDSDSDISMYDLDYQLDIQNEDDNDGDDDDDD